MGSTVAGSEQNRITDGDVPGDPNGTEFPDCVEARSTLIGGARYKLMTPAKLPISRATCISIPPGLSPSSLLESPVLLTNMKVEPSPTTGSFIKSHMVHGYSSSDEGKSSNFDSKPHIKANMVSANLNGHRSEQSVQVQVQVHGVSSPAELNADEINQRILENTEVQPTSFDHKGTGVSIVADRSSDDGYNWRKYGQKHVKGSEFPRSYYKCTHPNCEVKKLFERSLNGQITEIIYKGTHDHPKPQPSRRYMSANVMSMQEGRFDKPASLTGQDANKYGYISHSVEPNDSSEHSLAIANDDGIEGSGSFPNRNLDEANDDDPFSKRRRMEAGGFDVTPVIKPVREPRVVVQTLSEVDILDDGYRWRKYGQKVVRGNPNPRSYYKCTNLGCHVRKHVERASHDLKAVITTYEGKHNHDVPAAKSSSHDTAGPSLMGGRPSKFRSEEGDAISLDLGVGSNDYGQTARYEPSHRQPLSSTANFRVVQAKPISMHFGVINGGMNQYGLRENEGTPLNHCVINGGMNQYGLRENEGTPLNHSAYSYPQNIGRILTGP